MKSKQTPSYLATYSNNTEVAKLVRGSIQSNTSEYLHNMEALGLGLTYVYIYIYIIYIYIYLKIVE